MKQLFIFFVFLLTFIRFDESFGQNEEELALQSLHYLDKRLFLHFGKMNEQILISTDKYKYVCNEYVKSDTLDPLVRLRFKYDLKYVGRNKYNFSLWVVSEFTGSFVVSGSNGTYSFSDLKYVEKSD